MSQVAHQAGAYLGFCSMKRLGIFLLSPGWDAGPLQGHFDSYRNVTIHMISVNKPNHIIHNDSYAG